MYKQKVRGLLADVQRGLLEREECASLVLLTMFSGKTIFLYGPPGTAKSLLARRVSTAFGATNFFAALMHRFSTPEDIFGPIDIGELKKNNLVRNTEGYLPKAHFAFLDEIWKSSPAILNTLLTILNERLFRNGGKDEHVPLKGVVCASNEFPPKNQGLEALYDRCLVRYFVKPLQSAQNFSNLIQEKEMSPLIGKAEDGFLQEDLEKIQKEAKTIGFSQKALDTLLEIKNTLEKLRDNPQLIASYLGITENTETEEQEQNQSQEQDQDLIPYVSDRRFKQCGELLRVSALLSDSKEVEVEDLVLLRHCLWDHTQQIPLIDAILRQCLKQGAHTGLKELEKIEEEFNYLEFLHKQKGAAEFKDGWQRLNTKVCDQISALEKQIQERAEKANVFLSANDHKIAFLGAQEALEQTRVLQLKLEEMLHDPEAVFAKRAQEKAGSTATDRTTAVLDSALVNKIKQGIGKAIPDFRNLLGEQKQIDVLIEALGTGLAEFVQGIKSKEEIEKDLQKTHWNLLLSQSLLNSFVSELRNRKGSRPSNAEKTSQDFVNFLVTEVFNLANMSKTDKQKFAPLKDLDNHLFGFLMQKAIETGILPYDYDYAGDYKRGGAFPIVFVVYFIWEAAFSTVLSALESEKNQQ
ncbi:AAA family ATPase [Helicobacter suis]|uniref:AAA family ATPase n=1 Tax=Helicobacter suis TaxID=104628 RepID=UPI0013D6020A|nr:AAA family ATPase [Helicobacter suis]